MNVNLFCYSTRTCPWTMQLVAMQPIFSFLLLLILCHSPTRNKTTWTYFSFVPHHESQVVSRHLIQFQGVCGEISSVFVRIMSMQSPIYYSRALVGRWSWRRTRWRGRRRALLLAACHHDTRRCCHTLPRASRGFVPQSSLALHPHNIRSMSQYYGSRINS